MMPKFRVWDKKTKSMWNIDRWHVEDEYFDLIEPNKSVADPNANRVWRKQNEVILMQSTGVYDKHGVEIFEGNIIQQVHAYDYSILEIETDFLEPFEVKKGNYVQGKWIAEEIDGENYSVVRYVFGKDVKVIGNVHQHPELLEGV